MVNNIAVLTGHFLVTTFAKKVRYLLLFILPLAGMIGTIVLFGTPSTSDPKVAVVSEDNGTRGSDLEAFLSRAGFAVVPMTKEAGDDSESMVNAVRDGKVNLALVIPRDFSRKINTGDVPTLTLMTASQDGVTAALQSEVNLFLGAAVALDAHGYREFLAGSTLVEVQSVDDTSVRREGAARGIGFFVFVMVMQAFSVVQLTLKEREERTYARILVAPVTSRDYVAANMIAAYLVLASQVLFALTVVVFILGFDLYAPFGAMLAVLLAFGLPAVALAGMVITLSGTSERAGFLAPMVILPSSMLAGCFWPSTFMPETVQRLARFFPQTWIMEVVDRLQRGSVLKDLTGELLVFVAFTILFGSASALKGRYDREAGVQ